MSVMRQFRRSCLHIPPLPNQASKIKHKSVPGIGSLCLQSLFLRIEQIQNGSQSAWCEENGNISQDGPALPMTPLPANCGIVLGHIN